MKWREGDEGEKEMKERNASVPRTSGQHNHEVCGCTSTTSIYSRPQKLGWTLHSRNGIGNTRESVEEHDEPNDGGREEPRGVVTKPGEVDANLLTIISPARKRAQYFLKLENI
jgi:hypothetical protein